MKQLLLLLLLSPFLQAQDIPFKDLDAYIEKEMLRWKIPGLAVAIVKDGKVILSKGYGIKETGKPGKVDENTLFAIASNSKAYTGTLMAVLENQGKLSLADKVKKYIPDFTLMDSLSGTQCNLIDLLSHRIGYRTFDGDFVAWGTSYSSEELIHKLRYIKPAYDFRTRYGYFNMGFVTAGGVMQKITGKTWNELVKEIILDPLGMKRTFASITEIEKDGNVASPHTYNELGKVVKIPYRNLDNIAACGALNSSVSDCAKWLLYQMDTTNFPIKRQCIRATWKGHAVVSNGIPNRQTPGAQHFGMYGMGWFLSDYYGKLLIHHSGGADGMLSKSGFIPELDLGIVVLTNYDDQDLFEALFYDILDSYFMPEKTNHSGRSFDQFNYFLDKRNEEWKKVSERAAKKTKMPPVVKTGILGKYFNTHYGCVEILNEKNELVVNFQGHKNLKGYLTFLGGNEFLITYNDPCFRWAVVPFELNGKVVSSLKLDLPDFLDMLVYEFRR